MADLTKDRLSALKSALAALSALPEADARHLSRFLISRHGRDEGDVVAEYSKEIQDRTDAEQREKLRQDKVLADAAEIPGVTVTVDGVEGSATAGKAKKGN